MKSGFVEKLLERFDKLDRDSLQSHFMRLVEERGLLETIFQSIQEGIVVTDADGKMTYANRAAERLMGFSLEKSEGRPVFRTMREIDWKHILDLGDDDWQRLVSREVEITYPQHRFVSCYAVPLGTAGTGDGAVVILRDVTQERLQEASMVESERLNAVKLLAAGVAHEIGNPLNALHIHLQLLEREIRGLPDQWRESLGELVEVAGSEIQRLDLIITQFLKAIRPTKPKLAPTNIEGLLKESLLLMRPEVQNRNIDVRIERVESLPKIAVDRDQIKQVFFNIIRNAIQAMSDGGALSVKLSTSSRYLMVAFEDTGEGIKPENFGRLFEPYHTTKPDGSGLGLMIVQRILQDHGGLIDVQSKPGIGTRFTVSLPLLERRVRLLKSSDEEAAALPGEVSDHDA
jgi:two-component system, sporulation sensor kinase E